LIDREKAINSSIVLPKIDPEVSKLASHTASENLIIEGDNFDSLRLLNATHRGRVRVIYIDPPYNTGSQDFVYNDNFLKKDDRWRHSKWLEFLFQRLTLARDLLTPDGVIMVSINDENRAKLEMLMDEVMPGRRLGSMVWRTRQGSNDTKSGYLSGDHEHILVYANSGFRFKGVEKSYSMYENPNGDPRGPWRLADITCSKDFKARPNLYYPLIDPESGVHYPPNPDSTWRYQQETMNQYLSLGQISFPGEGQVVRTWNTLDELLAAIGVGDIPKSGRKPLLRVDLPNLEDWVGVLVGFGRPQFKRYKADLKETHQPLSSWIVPKFEEGRYDAPASFVSTTNHEGASGIANIFGNRVFDYAKPATLIRHLLNQATRPGDTVLDFFAGSGTTGHAVLELNAQDNGNRKFILCSSTEATTKDPDKNLCRDVCAERIRRVMDGYGTTEGLGGDFAYLTMDLVEEADLDFEATPEHAFHLISLRETGFIGSPPAGVPIWEVARAGHGSAVIVCPSVNDEAFAALKALNLNNLVVYSARPGAVEDALEGVCAVDSRNLDEAFRYAQSAHAASRSANIADLATTEAAV